jgi:hypothetical protein
MPIDDLLDKLHDAEQRFAGVEFMAPIVDRGFVVIRIANVVCRIKSAIDLPAQFNGWAILKARSIHEAEFIRQANLSEISRYLGLFPPARLILALNEQRRWLALPAQRGDARFRIDGAVVVQLPEDGLDRFETIVARFDGRLFWYERRDSSRDPSIAAYLREQLTADQREPLPKPDELHKPGLSREERETYGFVRASLLQQDKDRVEARLTDALDHAGAKYRSHVEREDVYVVTYEVDGRSYRSTIQRDDLTVATAGICLAGQDRRFDLTSLVGVLREANEQGRLVRVGDDEDLDEEAYRRVHPPE